MIRNHLVLFLTCLIALADVETRADGPRATSTTPAGGIADELELVQINYETKRDKMYASQAALKTREEKIAAAKANSPDFPGHARRIMELAEKEPKSPAARDAMIWIIEQTLGYASQNPYAGEFTLATEFLIRHHGDDPDAVSVALMLGNATDAFRDAAILGFNASAKGREAKGLARLALAEYLERKAKMAAFAAKTEGRPTSTFIGVMGDDGKIRDEKQPYSDQAYAYVMQLKQTDPKYLEREAERLYDEVVADYFDVEYGTPRHRQLEKLLANPKSTRFGGPLTDEQVAGLKKRLEKKSTLGRVALSRIEERTKLVAGKPAPEIDGVDVDGKPLKLADFQGKVVCLVFWGTWCGPCMREIPREKALVEKMKGRPFAMLGVNTDPTAEKAKATIKAEGITWPNWHDGEPGEGPIVKRYHIKGFPTVYVIDAKGIIRSTSSLGESLDKLVETLVAELEKSH